MDKIRMFLRMFGRWIVAWFFKVDNFLLSGKDFKNTTLKDLILSLDYLPDNIREISFSGNNFYLSNLEEVIFLLSFTSSLERQLVFSKNTFHLEIDHNSDVNAYSVISDMVQKLNLYDNKFHLKLSVDLPLLLSHVPDTVQKLKFYNNDFKSRDANNMHWITFTPNTIHELTISDSHFYVETAKDLGLAFSHIPSTVRELAFYDNNLQIDTVEDFNVMLSYIGSTVAVLDLSNNYLSSLEAEDLRMAFSYIPNTVRELRLSSNDFYSETSEELNIAFSGVKNTVAVLDLSYNDLDKKSAEDLLLMLGDGLKSINKIVLRNSEVCEPQVLSVNSTKTQEVRDAFMLQQSKIRGCTAYTKEYLELNAAIMPGLFFSGFGELSRTGGFDKDKLQQAILCLFKSRGHEFVRLPEAVALKWVGKYLAPIEVARIVQTCRPQKESLALY